MFREFLTEFRNLIREVALLREEVAELRKERRIAPMPWKAWTLKQYNRPSGDVK